MRIFAYGTLQLEAVLEAVIGRRLRGAPALLHGYRRRRLRREVYPAIVPADGESVGGVVYDGVDDRELVLLDEFESDVYDRREVSLEGGTRAWAWILAPRRLHLLGDEPWDLDEFRRIHGDAFLAAIRR